MKNDFKGKSLKRVFEYLQDQQLPVTMTRISTDLNLSFYTVQSIVDQLKEFNKIDVTSNGHFSLIQVINREDDNG